MLLNELLNTFSNGWFWPTSERQPQFTSKGGFGNRSVLLAYEQDGQPLPTTDRTVRLVMPGDLKGRRYVSSLIRLTVLPAAPPASY